MATQILTALKLESYFIGGLLLCSSITLYAFAYYGGPYFIFAYNCFLKPFTATSEKGTKGGQQDALESFYKGQATIYDATRSRLLRGREEMLALAAAQLRMRNSKEGFRKRVWVDIGGGTGWNIEKLNKYMSVTKSFSQVYLVDLSPSLCAVARDRFTKLGWTNVKVVCMDAREFHLEDDSQVIGKADWITMSYSLSMIPDYYSVLDSLSKLLSPSGIISVADFYVQSSTNITSKNYTGGILGRHVNWFSRQFWRIWFEFDRVNLDESRRDYLEYIFGTVLTVNERNVLLGGIPYYVWIGCPKSAVHHTDALAKLDAAATNSPYLSPVRHEETQRQSIAALNTSTERELRSKGFEAAVLNLSLNLPLPSFFYQNHEHYRIYYDELLQKHTQFNSSYIYAFTWEDPRVDQRILKLTPDDVVLAITSAGDNLLSYIIDASPKRVHAVDLNPSQNHLLELKLSCFSAALPYNDIWQIFGTGRHRQFREILISKLSPHMSSRAFQFWLDRTTIFTSASGGGLYETGQSGIAIRTAKWLFRIFGAASHVIHMCTATTLHEQQEIWNEKVRPVILSWWVSWGILRNERFLWKAMGVPKNQRDLILTDYYERSGGTGGSGNAIWEYVVNTFDPIINSSLLSNDNYFYLLCLTGKYTKTSHPSYLSPGNYKKLTAPGAFSGVRIHTDELNEVLARLKPGTLTVAVVMDSMDWFDPKGTDAREQIRRLNMSMKVGGRVMLRSAGLKPWYVDVFEEEGFVAKRVGTRNPGSCIDRVNMYASTWICTKRREAAVERERSGSLDGLLL